jgi:hypothetical protein
MDFLLVSLSGRIAALAAERRLPALYEQRMPLLVGGLMSYGVDLTENYRQGAAYIDRILKGAHPPRPTCRAGEPDRACPQHRRRESNRPDLPALAHCPRRRGSRVKVKWAAMLTLSGPKRPKARV